MGQPIEHPLVKSIAGFPQIIEVKKLGHERVNFGGIWHSDTTYFEQPPMGTMLLSKEAPSYGGDTLLANQVLAQQALSDTMQRLLAGLVGISSSAKADVSRTREDRMRGGEPRRCCASSVRAPDQARVHLPPVMTAGHPGVLGQPVGAAQPGERLPRLSPHPAADHAGGHAAGLNAARCRAAVVSRPGPARATPRRWPGRRHPPAGPPAQTHRGAAPARPRRQLRTTPMRQRSRPCP
jgi:hypothetical protein